MRQQSKSGRQLAAGHASLSVEDVAIWSWVTLFTLLTFKVRTDLKLPSEWVAKAKAMKLSTE